MDGLSIKAQGRALDLSEETFGEMRDSSDVADSVATLRARLAEEGYILLRAFLDRDLVLETRAEVLRRLKSGGHLHCAKPMMDAVAARDAAPKWMPDLTRGNAPLQRLLYHPQGPMIDLYQRLLGGTVRHFDHTWMRAIGPGLGTPPHCDSVYMGRGTHRLFTSWVPLGDVPVELGGLLLLEGSNRHARLTKVYCHKDVDSFCINRPAQDGAPRPWSGPARDGWLSRDPSRLGRGMRLRWLTADFRAGDVCVFSVHTVHGSLDNQTDRIRLSCDARYQRADEPADERWIGPSPPGHEGAVRKGVIC